jgi:hypothetical protein
MKDSFNSNFYITAATVIPLLYITLFLQGQLIHDLAKKLRRTFFRVETTLYDWETKGKSWIKRSLGVVLGLLFQFPALLISYVIIASSLSGIVAESLSLWTLYYQSDNLTMRAIVLWSMIGLLVLVSVRPTITIIRLLDPDELPDESDKKADPTKAGDQNVDTKTSNKAARSSTGLGWPSSDQSTTQKRQEGPRV